MGYFSRKLLPQKERYSTVEKECLAIKLAVTAFSVYLLGRSFTIETDHRSLEWFHKMKDSNARLTRWSLFLQPYQFSVRYKSGKEPEMLTVSLMGQPLAGCLRRRGRCEGMPPNHWLQASFSCSNLIELIIVYYVCVVSNISIE